MDPLVEEESGFSVFTPFTVVLQLLAAYGWYAVGVGAVGLYALHRLSPAYHRWRQAREDADYHKDPDKALSRMEAVQRARELQQRRLEAASLRAVELQKEREERKRQEALERLQKYGAAAGSGQRLGSDQDFLPLSGGASTSSYKPPKRSACARGGCGR